MNNKQPNFEKVKTAFYRQYVNSDKATFAILCQNLAGVFLPTFHQRFEDFKKDFNTWLDRLDIRQAGAIIDVMKKENVSLPSWIRDKRYALEYNQHDFLDLIPID